MTAQQEPSRLQLIWPGGTGISHQNPDGSWRRIDELGYALQSVAGVDASNVLNPQPTSICLPGQRLTALAGLKNLFRESVRLAYFDLPRLEIDDASSAFKGDGDRRYSSWLGVVNDHIAASLPLLSEEGVLVLLAGDREEPLARLLLHQLVGPDNYVGTIVWQRHYSARQVPNSREVAAAHDFLLIAAKRRTALAPVAVRGLQRGLKHTDSDPRGPWKGGHKGARKPDYPYGTHVPPYRWRVTSGQLPPGVWRLNEQTGVIWAPELTAAGEFELTVEVTDSAGSTAEAMFHVQVTSTGTPTDVEYPMTWLWEPPSKQEALSIRTTSLPNGVVGHTYSAMLEATGGEPFTGEKWPGKGRYQEFPKHTLERAVREDKVMFGRDGSAIPWIKKHADPDDVAYHAVYSIWNGREPASPFGDAGAGWTQDATKHLDQLRDLGLIKRSVTIGKPETLMHRFLHLFTEQGDWVLEVFGPSADMASTSLKGGRHSIFLAGDSDRDRDLLSECSRPRLEVVADMRDEHPAVKEKAEDAYESCLRTAEGGRVVDAVVLGPLATQLPDDLFPSLTTDGPFDARTFMVSQGFLPLSNHTGQSLDGRRKCEVLLPDEYLSQIRLGEIFDRHAPDQGRPPVSVYYFKALELPETSTELVDLIRIPFDLSI